MQAPPGGGVFFCLLSARTTVNPVKEEDVKREWLRRNEIVCICRGIPRKRFQEAIRQGAATLRVINRVVGSGSGDCKGERCGPKIETLLHEWSRSEKNRT